VSAQTFAADLPGQPNAHEERDRLPADGCPPDRVVAHHDGVGTGADDRVLVA
jgi:hypothetical protein